MVLKIFGHPLAASSRSILLVLEVLSIPYQLTVIDLQKGQQKLPPFGQIPSIDDEGFKLFESRAIARYLALKYGGIGRLIPDPTDLQKTAIFEQGMSIEQSNLDSIVAVLNHEILLNPLTGTLGTNMEGYEALLSRQRYIEARNLPSPTSSTSPMVHSFGTKTEYEVLKVPSQYGHS